jgi:uncharacterized membrane protein
MNKDLILIILGILVALVPFLGFPSNWDAIVFTILGALIVIFVLLLRRDFVNKIIHAKRNHLHRKSDTFVENGVSPQKDTEHLESEQK